MAGTERHFTQPIPRGSRHLCRNCALQYADYASWQREYLQGALLEKQLAYWKRQLAGAPAVLELPHDHSRPALPTHRGAQRSELLCRELTRSLEELNRREGVTLFMTLLAAFQTLLARYSSHDDIVVGTAIAGEIVRRSNL